MSMEIGDFIVQYTILLCAPAHTTPKTIESKAKNHSNPIPCSLKYPHSVYDLDALYNRLVILCHGAVFASGYRLADGIHHIHSLRHIAEAGILPVQIDAVLMYDKKLGAGAVFVV